MAPASTTFASTRRHVTRAPLQHLRRDEQTFDDVLRRTRVGDQVAFAVLWRALQPPLVRYLRALAGAGADDLAAETWLEVIRGLDRFDGGEVGFRRWVFTIARHRHLDWCRARARTPALADGDHDLTAFPSSDDPAGTVETADATTSALRLIGRLPRDQADVIALRVIGDLDVHQVATIMGKRPGTVRVLAHRGLRRLARLIEDNVALHGV